MTILGFLIQCCIYFYFREFKRKLKFFIFIALDTSDKVDVIRDLINEKLPAINYSLLKYVVEFLTLVAENSNVNKMNVKNLSIIFGPNFLWPSATVSSATAANSTINEFSLKNIECVNSFVELLIKFNKEIFVKEN